MESIQTIVKELRIATHDRHEKDNTIIDTIEYLLAVARGTSENTPQHTVDLWRALPERTRNAVFEYVMN